VNVLTNSAPEQFIATTDDVIEQLRSEIFRGQLDDGVLCEVMGWSDDALKNAIAQGLPFYRIGRRRLFDVVAVRFWVISRQEVQNGAARKRNRSRRSSGR
jgi:hypothetical protein